MSLSRDRRHSDGPDKHKPCTAFDVLSNAVSDAVGFESCGSQMACDIGYARMLHADVNSGSCCHHLGTVTWSGRSRECHL